MLNWLKKLAGTGSPSDPHSASYPSHELEWLEDDFRRLEEPAPGIAGRIMEHLVTGEKGPEVLAEVRTIPSATSLVRLRCDSGYFMRPKNGGLTRFFTETSIRDVAFHLRLAHVLAAIASTGAVHCETAALHAAAPWLAVYIWEATRNSRAVYPRMPETPLLTAADLEAMLQQNGDEPSLLVRGALWNDPQDPDGTPYARLLRVIPGINEALTRHPGTVTQCLANREAKARAHLLAALVKASYPLSLCLDAVLKEATGSSKQSREVAQGWLAKEPALAVPAVEQAAVKGGAEERFQAVKLLIKLQGDASHAFLKERVGTEKAGKIVEEIRRHLAMAETGGPRSGGESVLLELPPLPEIDPKAPLEASVLQDLKEAVASANAEWLTAWEKIKHQKWAPKKPVRLDPGQAEPWFTLLHTLRAGSPGFKEIDGTQRGGSSLESFAAHPAFHLVHAFRWCLLLRPALPQSSLHLQGTGTTPLEMWAEKHRPYELRELAAVCSALGHPDRWIGEAWLVNSDFLCRGIMAVAPEQAWSYFSERLELLRRALGWLPPDPRDPISGYMEGDVRENAWRALAAFPAPPPPLLEGMWDVALGTGKTERPMAQAALLRAPGRDERIIATLSAGQMERRAVAAEWLGRLKAAAAEAPLRRAFLKEKHETARAAMLSALERLGVPPDEFLDRKLLHQEAVRVMGRELPPALKWFPMTQLPEVRWGDGGGVVPAEVFGAWLVQACKLKSPEPGPLLRRYVASMHEGDREALGQWVLTAWLSEDVRVPSRQECETRAMQMAHQTLALAQRYPQYYQKQTLEEFYAEHLTTIQNQPVGSAIDSKGILSLVAACGGSGAAAPVAAYLKKWYGQRVHQCKALLQMLAWTGHPSATQTLLAIGTRFRTKSLQEEATRLAQEIADRNGWSLAELADRTIPPAGFDENGLAELDYGPRQFTLRLNDAMEVVLMDEDGKAIKALPASRKDDNEELAAAARKQFAATRKEVKQVIEQQRANLYEAMCLQRTWRYEDWELYLNRHPVARHLCQRLVWMAEAAPSGPAQVFRPLADGTLTDVEDNALSWQPEDRIRLAHGAMLPSDAREAWTQHLADYDVAPLFDQLSRQSPEIAGDKKKRTELRDFEGWVVEAFKLRGRATKLGYSRGTTGDGGWFNEYVKRFPTAGLQAVVEFSGNSLPEENRLCATLRLAFQPHGSAYDPADLPLALVPPVLLAECWNDFRQMAADGTGYDPEWSKKCG